jgi:hypothetical protein
MTENAEFLPFNAINEYMRPDFRLKVVRDTLSAQSTLDEHLSHDLNLQIKKYVTVPGFRSSDKAPALVKVLPASKAFEKNADLVAILLACWAETQSLLRDQTYTVLKDRKWHFFPEKEDTLMAVSVTEAIKDWPVFPITMDRTKLPGFYIHWPKGEDFEVVYKTYSELFPNSDASIDKVSLMVVWLTMRLPFQVDADLDVTDQVQLPSTEL